MNKIKIGTMVGGQGAPKVIKQIRQYGFETFALTFGRSAEGVNLEELAKEVLDSISGTGIKISAVGAYGNPLSDSKEGQDTKKSLERLFKAAKLFGADIVSGFTGAVTGESVEKSMPRFREVFTDLCKKAKDEGVKIAFENCSMGGTWNKTTTNLALNPDAWELMFNELPFDNVGLQWEPCHQMVQLIEPLPQLRKWTGKIFNIHGKDATIDRDVIKKHGIAGSQAWCFHRTPGFGDSNWTDIISMLRMHGYEGSIDIEGWHDPVYRGELEYTGQVHALNYLKTCRGGDFVPNP